MQRIRLFFHFVFLISFFLIKTAWADESNNEYALIDLGNDPNPLRLTCGVDAVYLSLKLLGHHDISYDQCAKAIPLSKKGSSLKQLHDFLQQQNLYTYRVYLNEKNLEKLSLGIYYAKDHFYVISKLSAPDNYMIYNGVTSMRYSKKQLNRHLSVSAPPSIVISKTPIISLEIKRVFASRSLFYSLLLLNIILFSVLIQRNVKKRSSTFCIWILILSTISISTLSAKDDQQNYEILDGLYLVNPALSVDILPTSTSTATNYTHTFEIENRTDKSIHIKRIQSSCGCSNLELSSDIIKPFGKVALYAYIEGLPGSSKTVNVNIETNNHEKGTFHFFWRIKECILQSNEIIHRKYNDNTPEVDRINYAIAIYNFSLKTPFQIIKTSSDNQCVKVSSVVSKEVSSINELSSIFEISDKTSYLNGNPYTLYEITIDVDTSEIHKRHGRFHLNLESNVPFPGKTNSILRVPIEYNKLGILEYSPSEIIFIGQLDKIRKRKLSIRCDGNSYTAYNIKIIGKPEFVIIERDEAQEGIAFSYTVELNTEILAINDYGSPFLGNIIIEIQNEHKIKKIEVPIYYISKTDEDEVWDAELL